MGNTLKACNENGFDKRQNVLQNLRTSGTTVSQI